MTVGQAIVLGIVQGITEFLPISSTAHLRVISALLGWPDPGAAYSAVIQLGTLGATLAYFARDLWGMARGLAKGLVRRQLLQDAGSRLAIYVIAGTVPIGVAGLAFEKWIDREFRSIHVIAAALILLGVLLYLAERLSRRERGLSGLDFPRSQIIGAAQALALVPGASRSGVTLTAGLFCGLTRDAAARYSFLLSVPAVAAAGIFKLGSIGADPHSPGGAALVAGTVAAFFSGYLAIEGLLRFLRTRSTLVFVIYRIVLGVALVALSLSGLLQP